MVTDMIVYGIPNCDTVKKALTWLKQHNIEYSFHNYKTEGITSAKLNEWSKLAGWEVLLNKKSTTWRGLSPEVQATVTNQKEAVKVMRENTSLIKRPVIEYNNHILVGFKEEEYKQVLKGA